MWIRRALVAALLATTLTGCGVSTHTCVSWVWFDTPQAVYDDARLVVRAEVGDVVGTRHVLGVDSPVHRVEVVEVLKGESPGPQFDVASTPVTCTGGDDFLEGDPLEVDGEVILFLFDLDGGWRLLTPVQGVLPWPPDGTLPFELDGDSRDRP